MNEEGQEGQGGGVGRKERSRDRSCVMRKGRRRRRGSEEGVKLAFLSLPESLE